MTPKEFDLVYQLHLQILKDTQENNKKSHGILYSKVVGQNQVALCILFPNENTTQALLKNCTKYNLKKPKTENSCVYLTESEFGEYCSKINNPILSSQIPELKRIIFSPQLMHEFFFDPQQYEAKNPRPQASAAAAAALPATEEIKSPPNAAKEKMTTYDLLGLVKSGNALIKAISNTNLDFYIDQMDPKITDPARKRPSRTKYFIQVYSSNDPERAKILKNKNIPKVTNIRKKTAVKDYQVGVGKAVRNGNTLPHTYTKKTSTTLIPSDPRYMSLAGEVGIVWDIRDCDLSDERYVLAVNGGTNLCQWLGTIKIPADLYEKAVSVADLKAKNDKTVREKKTISHNEILAKLPFTPKGFFIKTNNIYNRILVLHMMHHTIHRLNIKELPIVIIEREACLYSLVEQIQDILDIFGTFTSANTSAENRSDATLLLTKNRHELVKKILANLESVQLSCPMEAALETLCNYLYIPFNYLNSSNFFQKSLAQQKSTIRQFYLQNKIQLLLDKTTDHEQFLKLIINNPSMPKLDSVESNNAIFIHLVTHHEFKLAADFLHSVYPEYPSYRESTLSKLTLETENKLLDVIVKKTLTYKNETDLDYAYQLLCTFQYYPHSQMHTRGFFKSTYSFSPIISDCFFALDYDRNPNYSQTSNSEFVNTVRYLCKHHKFTLLEIICRNNQPHNVFNKLKTIISNSTTYNDKALLPSGEPKSGLAETGDHLLHILVRLNADTDSIKAVLKQSPKAYALFNNTTPAQTPLHLAFRIKNWPALTCLVETASEIKKDFNLELCPIGATKTEFIHAIKSCIALNIPEITVLKIASIIMLEGTSASQNLYTLDQSILLHIIKEKKLGLLPMLLEKNIEPQFVGHAFMAICQQIVHESNQASHSFFIYTLLTIIPSFFVKEVSQHIMAQEYEAGMQILMPLFLKSSTTKPTLRKLIKSDFLINRENLWLTVRDFINIEDHEIKNLLLKNKVIASYLSKKDKTLAESYKFQIINTLTQSNIFHNMILMQSNAKSIQMLLDKNEDREELITETNSNNETPISLAIHNKKWDILSCFLGIFSEKVLACAAKLYQIKLTEIDLLDAMHFWIIEAAKPQKETANDPDKALIQLAHLFPANTRINPPFGMLDYIIHSEKKIFLRNLVSQKYYLECHW
jgi:hypothetical protein